MRIKQLFQFGALLILVHCIFACSLAVAGETAPPAPTGAWEGTIASRAGDVNFVVDLKPQTGKLTAALVNATDRQPFSSVGWDGKTLTLRLDYYDGQLNAHYVSPQRMEGEYSRLTSKGVVHVPVTLAPQKDVAAAKAWTGPSLDGDWVVFQPEEQGAERNTLASFQQQKMATPDGSVAATGVLEPVSGDTGLMHGRVSTDGSGHTRLHLSRFDGIHILALDAELQADGSLKGQMGGVKFLSPFTATRSTDASTDPNLEAGSLTKVRDPQEPLRFQGTEAAGKTLDQNSPIFKGKPLIVDIFGTWCPNCHDEAPLLEELYRKYHPQGLEIVGLAYEYVDDTERNLRQIGIYRTKYGLTFPLLLAGTTDQGQIQKTLPQLVNFGAFPTAIFVDRNGRVHGIHAGFAGPSTGEKYQEVQQHMDQLTREIVAPTN